MPQLLGYNRWITAWPNWVPPRVRWPRFFWTAASWPYQWRITRTQMIGDWDPSWAEYATATFITTENDITLWSVFPSLVRSPSLTFMTIQLDGDENDPDGISRKFNVQEEYATPFESLVSFTPYTTGPGGRGPIHIRNFTLVIRDNSKPPYTQAAFDVEKADYAGQIWPPE